MSTIQPLTNDAAPADARPLLEAVEAKLGKAPNLFRVLAHAPAGLQAYLGLSETLGGGVLSAQEREVIALATGEVNGCDYCLAAHTTIGKMVGLSEAQTLGARTGNLEDPKLDALTKFTRAFVSSRGHASDDEVAAFKAAGYGDAQLVELVANVAQNLFTNYMNDLAGTEVDFPAAPALANA